METLKSAFHAKMRLTQAAKNASCIHTRRDREGDRKAHIIALNRRA